MLQQANAETCRPTLPEPQPSPVKHGTFCAEPVLVDRPGLLCIHTVMIIHFAIVLLCSAAKTTTSSSPPISYI